jgi:hypothetical protein
MQIRPEEITSVLKREIEGFEDQLHLDEVGTVLGWETASRGSTASSRPWPTR